MNEEEKAKAYDEAYKKVAVRFGSNVANEIFLKESEDERIRKELLEHCKNQAKPYIQTGNKCPQIQSWIAWLEKQREQKPVVIPKFRVGDTIKNKKTNKIFTISDYSLLYEYYHDINHYHEIKFSEQDDWELVEQKLTNEPKFNVGDWVMLDRPVLITKVEDMPYNTHQYWTSDDTWFGDATKAKLWTIEDAKDGDVLVCPKYAGDIIPNIFIFKNINIKDNDVYCYCSFLKTFEPGGYIANADPINTDFYPATKEQRDTLMKAMADAGYTFDFKKKELKKIEQIQAIDYSDSLPKDNWELIHEFVNKFGRIPKDEDELNVLIEYVLKRQKPTEWSEEQIEECRNNHN